MKASRSLQALVAVLVYLLPALLVRAHSGIVRLREERGPFVITLFTSSDLVQGRATDVSVLVQKRDSNQAILDALVNFFLTPPRGSILEMAEPMCGQPAATSSGATSESRDGQITILARHEQSPNKLFYTASINFPLTGPWELDALVRHGADSAKVTCEIPVGFPARPLVGLVPYLVLPLLLASVFAVNQWLRTPSPRK